MKNIFKKNKKSFLFVPLGIQFLLFIIMILVYELFETIVPICIIFPVLLFGINFWLFKNKIVLSKKYNLKLDNVYRYFYWVFLISYFVLFGITLLLNNAGLILQCGGWFCGMDIAVFLGFFLPIMEFSICNLCSCIRRGVLYWKKKQYFVSILNFIFGIVIFFGAIAFIIGLAQ